MLNRLFGMRADPGEAVLEAPVPPACARPAEGQSARALQREPILGRDHRVAGYLFRVERPGGGVEARRAAAAQLATTLVRSGVLDRMGTRRTFAALSADVLDLPLFAAWPAPGTVWFLEPATLPEADGTALAVRMASLKALGHAFALPAGVADLAGGAELLKLADFVVLDAADEDPVALSARMARVAKLVPHAVYLAANVPHADTFALCHKLRCSYFMGAFVTRRDLLDTPAVSPARARVLDLIRRVQAGEDLPALARQVQLDAALSVRLLRYVNSPGMGLIHKVGSIEQALMVMGTSRLYRWLTVVLFTGDGQHAQDQALLEQALVRGRLAEQFAAKTLFGTSREEVFVTGLFSLLDQVMRQPMDRVLADIPLPAAIVEALLHRAGPYAPYLALAQACEARTGAPLHELAASLGFDARDIDAAHGEALAWAEEMGLAA